MHRERILCANNALHDAKNDVVAYQVFLLFEEIKVHDQRLLFSATIVFE